MTRNALIVSSCLFMGLQSVPNSAAAEPWGIASPAGDARFDKELSSHIQSALTEALVQSGHDVISADVIQHRRAAAGLGGCDTTPCWSEQRAQLGLEGVLLVSSFLSGGRPASIELIVVSEDGIGRADRSSENLLLSAVLPELLQEALRDAENEGEKVVRVSSQPPGAAVIIDERFVGTTPIDTLVTPGIHTLVVRHESAGEEVREFEVGSAAGGVFEMAVNLERDASESDVQGSGTPSGSTDRSKTRRLPLARIVTAGVVAAGASALFSVGMVGLVRSNSCSSRAPDGTCEQFDRGQRGISWGYTVAGLAGIASSVLLLSIPVRQTEGREASLSMSLASDRLVLSGNF
ncbi:MAG: PEGA domain-containing protein [Myxococcota bacterium]